MDIQNNQINFKSYEELIKLTKEQKIFTLEFFRLINKKPEIKDSLSKLLYLYLETTESKI